jgi:3-dehydrosphinganine reductase
VNRFNDRHAIVTGGSSGIGLAIARHLGQRGARVTLLARRPEPLADAVAQLTAGGCRAQSFAVDVTDRAAVTDVIAQATTAFGPCDLLVTSAGSVLPGGFMDLDEAVFRDTMEVDYFGTLWPIRAVVPSMIERRTGSIVGISSGAGLIGIYGYSAYTPAKFAVRGLLEVLRCELAPYGVHVGCVCPPDTDTPQLAFENQFKPAETVAISGAIKPISADRVAASVLRGIERERFLITADVQTRLLARVAGLVPGTLHRSFDKKVRQVRKAS